MDDIIVILMCACICIMHFCTYTISSFLQTTKGKSGDEAFARIFSLSHAYAPSLVPRNLY